MSNEQSEVVDANHQAYLGYLQNKAFNLYNATRGLKLEILLATSNNELSDETKRKLFDEFMAMASMTEVKR